MRVYCGTFENMLQNIHTSLSSMTHGCQVITVATACMVYYCSTSALVREVHVALVVIAWSLVCICRGISSNEHRNPINAGSACGSSLRHACMSLARYRVQVYIYNSRLNSLFRDIVEVR